MKGIVIKSTGSWHTVQTEDGTTIHCKLKGKFRVKGIKTTNPLAVGDKVTIKILPEEGTGLITNISPRHNYIIRKATKLSKVSHIIAANIDQAFLIVTLAEPRTSTGFIDRFLVTAEAYHIPACIVFNKIDIYDSETESLLDELTGIYENTGYPCYHVSALRDDNIGFLEEKMKNMITLFAGHSGVGKSALINTLQPGLNLKTKPISEVHQKGKHTTTFAEIIPLSFGGYIIDTPGIKEFGLYDLKKEEIPERYPEMRALMHNCKYNNCMHVHEPGCAVKEAVENGKISKLRYYNYLSIINAEDFNKNT